MGCARRCVRPLAAFKKVTAASAEDAQQLADDWREAGVEVAGPQDYDYGKREGPHVDPDGNVIRFGSPTPN